MGRTAKENCETELSSSTGKQDNDAGLSDRAVKGSCGALFKTEFLS